MKKYFFFFQSLFTHHYSNKGGNHRLFLVFLNLSLCFSLGNNLSYSQAPQSFKYQCVVRDNNDNPKPIQPVTFRFSILQGSEASPVIYSETHSDTTNNFGLVNLEIGKGIPVTGSFGSINWSAGNYYLKIELDENGGTNYRMIGASSLLSVPYALYAKQAESGTTGSGLWADGTGIVTTTARVGIGISNPSGILTVQGDASGLPDTALFEVKDKNGFTVFAVYEDGAAVYVNESAKGGRGSFAVGGRKLSKGITMEDILRVTPDSVRIYIKDNPKIKGGRGGFAVGGRKPLKGIQPEYFNIFSDTTPQVMKPSQSRIFWYPKKEAFLTGRVLVEDPDSVGTNSTATGFESKSIGNWSQAFGFKAIARQDYATAIGKNAIAGGLNSFAFGDGAKALNDDSYAFGADAEARGEGSFAFGYVGRDSLGPTGNNTMASGPFSFAFGLGSQAKEMGAFALGSETRSKGRFSMALGYQSIADNWCSLAMGDSSISTGGASTSLGYHTSATNWASTAIGHNTVASGAISFSSGISTQAKGVLSYALGDGTIAAGAGSIALGSGTIAGGDGSIAGGYLSQSRGIGSIAVGTDVLADSFNAVAFGTHTKAIGYDAVAIGAETMASSSHTFAGGLQTKALGDISVALGFQTTSEGLYSAAMGNNTIAKTFGSFVIGQFNDTSGIAVDWWNSWDPADPVFAIGDGTSETDRSNAFTVLKNGYVGIDTSYPGQKLDIVRGNGRVQSGYGWLTTSDLRYKKNISLLDHSLDKVLAIRGVRFDLKDDNASSTSQGRYIGFIAQELEQQFPELVITDAAGFKSVAYDKMTAILVEAVKEQHRQFSEQQKNMDKLTEENASLRSELVQLRSLQSQLNELKEQVSKNYRDK